MSTLIITLIIVWLMTVGIARYNANYQSERIAALENEIIEVELQAYRAELARKKARALLLKQARELR